jgi:tRNA nucleotidyltransferase (CCA-adding enzyme)
LPHPTFHRKEIKMISRKLDLDLPIAVQETMNVLERAGGTTYLVGGALADVIAGRPVNDWDIEVFQLNKDEVEGALGALDFSMSTHRPTFRRTFGAVRVDVSIPSRRNLFGVYEIDPDMPAQAASLCRDFTINTLFWRHGVVKSVGSGLVDIEEGVLRITNKMLLEEDPARYFRALQLYARKCRSVDASTKLELTGLARKLRMGLLEPVHKARVFEQLNRLLKAPRPSRGFWLLKNTRGLGLFPELEDLVGCDQHPAYHPEGDVWNHSLHVVDAAALVRDACQKAAVHPRLIEEELEVLMWSALLHDIGKPLTSVKGEDGVIRSHGHDKAGGPLVRTFMERITDNERLIDQVVVLCERHHNLSQVAVEGGDKAWRRLLKTYGSVEMLNIGGWLSRCDWAGRSLTKSVFDPEEEHPTAKVIWAQAPKIGASCEKGPSPIITGGDLIATGAKPGPNFKKALETALLAQQQGDTDPKSLLNIALKEL